MAFFVWDFFDGKVRVTVVNRTDRPLRSVSARFVGGKPWTVDLVAPGESASGIVYPPASLAGINPASAGMFMISANGNGCGFRAVRWVHAEVAEGTSPDQSRWFEIKTSHGEAVSPANMWRPLLAGRNPFMGGSQSRSIRRPSRTSPER